MCSKAILPAVLLWWKANSGLDVLGRIRKWWCCIRIMVFWLLKLPNDNPAAQCSQFWPGSDDFLLTVRIWQKWWVLVNLPFQSPCPLHSLVCLSPHLTRTPVPVLKNHPKLKDHLTILKWGCILRALPPGSLLSLSKQLSHLQLGPWG